MISRVDRGVALLAALLCWLAAAAAPAHNTPVPIELWGPFLPGTQTCLRLISRAAHDCFDTVLGIEQRCRDAALQGGGCDAEQRAAEIAEADRGLRATLAAACAPGQLTELSYIGFFDAATDLTRACSGEAHAAATALYAPAQAGGLSPAAAQCLTASAGYGRKMMRFALERGAPVMERIATRQLSGDEKKASILQVERELSTARTRWIDGLLDHCPQFETVYGRSAESLLRTLKQRTDCVLSQTYVHSAIACIARQCGDGIPQDPEACDDGNGDDGDACRNDC
ncbi:MAG: hypothetical protein ACRERC_17310, partial [Candidatus Binatia bacterium]